MDKIKYMGETYDTKSYNGYLFATEKLGNAIWNGTNGQPVSKDAEILDNQIAYYFEEDDFYGKDAKELYKIYNQHS